MPNKFKHLGIIFALTGLTVIPAHADQVTYFGQTADGSWLVGLDYGRVDVKAPGFRDADTFGLTVGYEFARPVGFNGSASVEFEITNSDNGSIGRESDFGGIGGFGTVGDFEADTAGLFFAYRTAGDIFFKGKLGAVRTEVNSSGRLIGSVQESETSFAFGGGLGYRIVTEAVRINIELEAVATTGDDDIDLLTIGGLFLF